MTTVGVNVVESGKGFHAEVDLVYVLPFSEAVVEYCQCADVIFSSYVWEGCYVVMFHHFTHYCGEVFWLELGEKVSPRLNFVGWSR